MNNEVSTITKKKERKILTPDQNQPITEPAHQELALSLQPPANFFQFPHPGCPHQNHPVYCNYPRFSRKSAGRKSEQHKRKRHEDNRRKYHTILSKSYLYTGKIPEYHRQIHPRHPHLHRLAGSAGTERHHQRLRDPLQKTSRSQLHAGQRQQHAHRLKRLLRIHRLARLLRHGLQDPAKPHLCAGKRDDARRIRKTHRDRKRE